MLPIKNKGRYFLKDIRLEEESEDEFHHNDIGKNIINILETEKAPYNIAIIGKWGLGKSSLISFITKHLEKSDKNFVITEINAWKYEKEALRRAFLRQVLIRLGYNDESTTERLLEELKSYKGGLKEKPMGVGDYIKEWFPLIISSLILYLVGVIFVALGKSVISFSSIDFKQVKSILLEGFKSSVYLPIFAILIQQYIKSSAGKYNFKLVQPLKSTDEYEDKLRKILNDKSNSKKILLTVIDDLDRLTPEKIVEALDAIKAFVNYKNCIFIVPFDEAILKSALKRKEVHFEKNENLTIESDLFLDKLFQYKIYLPNIVLSNMPEYAIKLSHKEIPDLCKLCGEELFDKICREILIHKNVTTPRQVKKIINAFANNLLLAYRREDNYLAPKTLTSEHGIKILAKISVLQADYSDFYSKLFKYPDLIDKLLEICDIKSMKLEMEEMCRPYFKKNSEGFYSINKESEGLINFLKRTSNIKSKDIARYLYLSEDRNSILFGDELSKSLKDSITSGMTRIVIDRLEENKNKNLVDLLNNILIYSEAYEYNNCITVLINVYQYYKNYSSEKLIDNIGEKTTAIYNSNMEINNEEVDFLNLLKVYLLSKDKYGLNKLICESLENYKVDIINKLKVFFNREVDFSVDAKNIIKSFINEKLLSCKDVSLQQFFVIEGIDIKKCFNEYFSDFNFISGVIKYLYENEIFDEKNDIYINTYSMIELSCQRNKTNEILEVIVEYLNDERMYIMVEDLLNKYANQINDIIGTQIISELSKINNEDLYPRINKLFCNIKWNIIEENKEDIDKYLNNNILNNIIIDDILGKIIENNEVNYIPYTVQEVNKNIVENVNSIEVIYAIQNQYNDDQRENMFEIIKNKIQYSNNPTNEIYNRVEALMKKLKQNAKNIPYINNIITCIYNNIINYPNNSYCIKALMIIECVVDVVSEEKINNLCNWANNSTYMSSYEIASMTILDCIKDRIKEELYLDIGTKVMKYGTLKTLPHFLRLLRKIRYKFINGTSQLHQYNEFLLKFIDEEDYRKEILQDIYDEYSSLGDIVNYILTIIKYEDVKELVIDSSVKFLNKAQSIEEKIVELIRKVSEEDLNTLYDIIQGVYGDRSIELLEALSSKVNKDSEIIYTFNLLIILLISGNNVKDSCITDLLVNLFDNADNKICINALNKVSKGRTFTNNMSKKQIGDITYTMFKKLNIDEEKVNIYKSIKEMGLDYSFKRENSKNRDFTKEEIKLMKSI